MKYINKNYMLVIAYFLCCLTMVLRRPDMIFNPQPWAEDGGVFINGTIYQGYNSIFQEYAGYFHLIPRVIAIISVHLSIFFKKGIELVPLFMNISAIGISSASVFFIVSPRFKWLAPLYLRITMLFTIILLPGMGEVYGTITNVQWWIGIFLFLVSWDILVKDSLPSGIVLCFTVISSLTGPFGVFVIVSCVFIFIRRWTCTKKIFISYRDLMYSLLICFGGIIQVITSFINRVSQSTTDFITFITYYPRVVFSGIFSRIILSEFKKSIDTYQFVSITLLGVVICYLLYYLNSSKKQLFFIPFLFCNLLLLLTFRGNEFFFTIYKEPFSDMGTRYIFIPFAIIIISLLAPLRIKDLKKDVPKLVVSLVLCILFLINISTNFKLEPYQNKSYAESVRMFNLQGKNQCKANINPGDFSFNFPCD